MVGANPSIDERLAELLALEAGWNGYRAPPIDRACAERVRAFFPLAAELGLQPWVCPLNDGGLQIERTGPDDWCVEFHPDGTASLNLDVPTDADAASLLRLYAQAIKQTGAA